MADIVNITDIAERAGVGADTVQKWVEGSGFPEPSGAGPIWGWSDVERWLKDAGRSWTMPDVWGPEPESVVCKACGSDDVLGTYLCPKDAHDDRPEAGRWVISCFECGADT